MPHLAGILDLRPAHNGRAPLLRALTRVLTVHPVDYATRSWSDEHFACVTLLNPSGGSGPLEQPAVSDDGHRVLFLDGTIHEARPDGPDTAAVIERLMPGAPARACIELYGKIGDKMPSLLDGAFNIVIYDARE